MGHAIEDRPGSASDSHGPYGNRRNTRARWTLAARTIYEGDAPGLARVASGVPVTVWLWCMPWWWVDGWWWRRDKKQSGTHSGTRPAASRAGSSPGQGPSFDWCAPSTACLRTSRSGADTVMQRARRKGCGGGSTRWCGAVGVVAHASSLLVPGPRRGTGWVDGQGRTHPPPGAGEVSGTG